MGVVGLITPWNYPFLQAVLKVAPALATGNTMVLKPSEHSSLTCLKLAELTAPILPAGVLQVVPGDGSVGAYMQTLDFDGMSFTGSTLTGSKILSGCA
jgi:acyl-CoA reductase-like NAD-dependent aldehyde dehydrogenase